MTDQGGAAPRVVIADDQALVRTGFAMILRAEGIEVVGDAADGEAAVAAVRRLRPDVVLMDIRMPVMDGLEATRRILGDPPGSAPGRDPGAAVTAAGHDQSRSGAPGTNAGRDQTGSGQGGSGQAGSGQGGSGQAGASTTRVIMLTTFDLDQYVFAALTAGASGFLLKDVSPDHLVNAVRLVRQGDALLAPTITRRLIERFARPDAQQASLHRDLAGLTARELEVLTLLAGGLSNAELAARLLLSEATVKTHVTRILSKLGLRDRVQAVVVAYETGLVTPGRHRDHPLGT